MLNPGLFMLKSNRINRGGSDICYTPAHQTCAYRARQAKQYASPCRIKGLHSVVWLRLDRLRKNGTNECHKDEVLRVGSGRVVDWGAGESYFAYHLVPAKGLSSRTRKNAYQRQSHSSLFLANSAYMESEGVPVRVERSGTRHYNKVYEIQSTTYSRSISLANMGSSLSSHLVEI